MESNIPKSLPKSLIFHGKVRKFIPEKQKVTIIEKINKNRGGSWRNSRPNAKNQAGE